MELIARVRQGLLALTTACLAVFVTSITANAAMDATLSSDHARPGDWLLLLSDDHNGRATYQGLSSEGIQPIYLASVIGDFSSACGGPVVARLAWRGNRGGVAFRVPPLRLGSYFLFIQTGGQCWRIGGTVAGTESPLMLTIGSTPAGNQDVAANWSIDSLGPSNPQRSQESGLSVGIVGIVVLAALIVAVFGGLRLCQYRRR